jgi:hypothetical protein
LKKKKKKKRFCTKKDSWLLFTFLIL